MTSVGGAYLKNRCHCNFLTLQFLSSLMTWLHAGIEYVERPA
ncbi:hypothetical protein SAMN03159362_0706 [Pseudomonas sp. NFIX51]|nr:hypothetical protein SAMN03159414_3695 [Pseudomonas sp. NFACC41-3]SMH33474.1 hypothetical protein SAMN03159362_0706 [Pseudomonas sp. NFIX51]